MIGIFGNYYANRRRTMSYKELLKKQIAELEQKIQSAKGEKSELEKQLNKLRLTEFEEDMATENTQVFLKG